MSCHANRRVAVAGGLTGRTGDAPGLGNGTLVDRLMGVGDGCGDRFRATSGFGGTRDRRGKGPRWNRAAARGADSNRRLLSRWPSPIVRPRGLSPFTWGW